MEIVIFMDWLHRFFNEHKGVRRIGLFVSYLFTGFALWHIMFNIVKIVTEATPAGAAIIATVFGVIGAPIIYYFHSRKSNDGSDK